MVRYMEKRDSGRAFGPMDSWSLRLWLLPTILFDPINIDVLGKRGRSRKKRRDSRVRQQERKIRCEG